MYSVGADNQVIKKKLKRVELLAFFANYPTSWIGIEAGGGGQES
jgi:transposase